MYRRGLLSGAAAIGLAQAVGGCSPAKAPASAPAPAPHHAGAFHFHSGFWTNLHHRLHFEALVTRRPPPPSAPRPPSAPAWAEVVGYYRTRFGPAGAMGLLFEPELIALHHRFFALGSAQHLSGVDAELTRHLEAAAALVRPEWPAHDRANRDWADALLPRLARHEAALLRDMTAAFQHPWPAEPIFVDVSAFAGPVGAYTVDAPPHIIISSADPAYAGDAALEMIFHEASHLLSEPVEKKLDAEASKRRVTIPKQLWHGVLFYVAGELARRRLGQGYTPYATKNSLWGNLGELAWFEKTWLPYLDGKTDLDTAIAALVGEAGRASP